MGHDIVKQIFGTSGSVEKLSNRKLLLDCPRNDVQDICRCIVIFVTRRCVVWEILITSACRSTELELCFLVDRTLILDCVDFDELIWWSKNETLADICEWGKALADVATGTTEISLRYKHHLCLE